jgi:hypothetical protein
MTEKCPVCGAGELTKVNDNPDFKESFYSCGHHPKLSRRSINEPAAKINDSASASKHVKRSVSEPTVNVSDSIDLLIRRFKQLPNVTIEEKIYDNTPSLQFSADRATKFFINNSTVKIILPGNKEITQNISPSSIEKIRSIFQESKPSSFKNKEEYSFLQTFTKILTKKEGVSFWARLKYRLARKKWVFPIATPFILKIIDILREIYTGDGG